MPDGTGDEVTSPSLTELHQLGWDMQYIRQKLTLNSTAKTFVWQKQGSGYVMTLGTIELLSGSILAGFRTMAAAIEANGDGSAPVVENFGVTSWTQAQLTAMYNNLLTIATKVMSGKRTVTMRMTSLAGTNVIFTIGDMASSSTSNRLAIQTLAGFVAQGLG